MFDLTSQESFEHVGSWIGDAKTVSSMYICMYVCVCVCFRFYSSTNSSVDCVILKLLFPYHLYLEYMYVVY